MSTNLFETLGLMPESLLALEQEGYTVPTPIQLKAIPAALKGQDILACAQTGTGKTAAFALPLIQRLVTYPQRRHPRHCRALIVAPTRELAAQIDQGFAAYGRHADIQRACVFGGVGKMPQVRAVARGVDVLTATPGRLLDLIGDQAIDLSKVEIVVFDEADRMLDMGFIRDVRKIIALLPKIRQTLLFSATMPAEIDELARGLLKNPVRIAIDPEKPAVELIAQCLYYANKEDKRDLLVRLLEELDVTRAIVFSRTKHGADRIAKALQAAGVGAGVIHANKGQGNRTRTMDAFKAGETRVMVATDIAARGIDVDDISHVFNFDMPTEPETYVHRIGRTARAGASGMAVSFCDGNELKLLKQVERLLGRTIPVSGGDPKSLIAEDPSLVRRDGRGRPDSGGGERGGRSPRSRDGYPSRNSPPKGDSPRSGAAPLNAGAQRVRPNSFEKPIGSDRNSGARIEGNGRSGRAGNPLANTKFGNRKRQGF